MSYSSIYIKNNIRMYASDLTEVAQEAMNRHQTSPLSSLTIATAIAAFAPFAVIKARGRTSSMIKSNGIIKTIIVESNSEGDVRALVGNPFIETEYDNDPSKDLNQIPIKLAIGDAGTLRVVHEYEGENFGGEVELANSDITTDLAYYFDQSEQIFTAIITDVRLESKTKLKRAFSVIFQMLPGHTEEDVTWLENFVKTTKLSTMSIEEYAAKVGGSYLGSKSLQWKCNCSNEKMKALVQMIDIKERNEILAEQGFIEVTCNFCNSKYKFDK